MADHCNDFSRSQVLRQAAATAGKGLPSIEPGMPLPAGTGLSRRSLLLRSAGMALSVYGGSKLGVGALEEGIAHAQAQGPRPVVVSVFMSGGADSLSLLAPVGDPRYAALRPTLAVKPDEGFAFGEDSRLRWHPSAEGLSTLHSEGKVSVLPAIGYEGADQSHFTSRHFWEVGELDIRNRSGWLGRYLDVAGAPDNPLQGLTMGGNLFPSLASAEVPVAALPSARSYTFTSSGVSSPIAAPMLDAYGQLGRLPSDSPALEQARWATRTASTLRQQLAPFTSYTSPVTYPSGSFSQRLGDIAAMLDAGLPLRCVATNAPGGYDDHANLKGRFPQNLKATSDTLLAFQRDLEARGLADRVLVLLWSEFGRRPKENGNGGTDHGAGGTALVIGSRAAGRMIGEFPGLATLDRTQNLRSTSDFRALYCSLLEQWLGTDAGPIIPGADRLPRPVLVGSS